MAAACSAFRSVGCQVFLDVFFGAGFDLRVRVGHCVSGGIPAYPQYAALYRDSAVPEICYSPVSDGPAALTGMNTWRVSTQIWRPFVPLSAVKKSLPLAEWSVFGALLAGPGLMSWTSDALLPPVRHSS